MIHFSKPHDPPLSKTSATRLFHNSLARGKNKRRRCSVLYLKIVKTASSAIWRGQLSPLEAGCSLKESAATPPPNPSRTIFSYFFAQILSVFDVFFHFLTYYRPFLTYFDHFSLLSIFMDNADLLGRLSKIEVYSIAPCVCVCVVCVFVCPQSCPRPYLENG